MKSVAEIFSSHEVLDSDGRHVNGTDKHGPNHQYGDAYDRLIRMYFSPKSCIGHLVSNPYLGEVARANIELMMEVGVADGSSLLAWSEIFPNATCVGLDIHRSARAEGVGRGFPPDRIEFHLGDMRVQRDCERAAAGRMFDFICEDATHNLPDTLTTLFYLWPYVKPGGIYVVEEFANVGALYANINAMWPFAKITDTQGPFGSVEPLVVLRKPL